MSRLAQKECIPCKGGVPPLKGAELEALIEQVGNGWRVADEHHLEKLYNRKPVLMLSALLHAQFEGIAHGPRSASSVANHRRVLEKEQSRCGGRWDSSGERRLAGG